MKKNPIFLYTFLCIFGGFFTVLSASKTFAQTIQQNTYYHLSCAWLGEGKVLSAMKDNKVKMFDKGTFKGQLWQFVSVNQQYFRLVPASNPKFSLTVSNDGELLEISKTQDIDEQKWKFEAFNNQRNAIRITNVSQAKSIDIINDGKNNIPHITEKYDVTGQSWTLKPAGKVNDQNNNNTNNNTGNNTNNNDNNDGTGGNQIAKKFLAEHNRIRSERGLPALKWSNALANHANEWATTLQSNCDFKHRKNNKYGENLAMGGGMGDDPAIYVRMWENEKQAFEEHFIKNGGKCCGGNFGSYGHYSQMVWRNTTELGCAMVKCDDGTYIVVCNYNPPGNMQGSKAY